METEKFYLINYLEDNFKENLYFIDILKMELDKRIYSHGDNFIYSYENNLKRKNVLKIYIKEQMIKLYTFFKSEKKNLNQNIIISNAYFNFSNEIEKLGFNVYNTPWGYISFKERLSCFYTIQLINYIQKIENIISKNDFKDLISNSFSKDLENLKDILLDFLSNERIRAMVFFADLPFFERLSIKILKELSKPSFIFLHGLFGMYNLESDNTSDYLIVWGDKLKENCIKNGFNKDKIIVSGHPYYKNFNKTTLSFSFDNILITSKPINGFPVGHKFLLSDRGNCILYLYIIEKVLKKIGVKNVRLRLHPSENPIWYYKFIDKSFFILDNDKLSDSLQKSSLVIGSASTVFIEALYYGVNYLLFEPSFNNIDVTNFLLAPPYDGSDPNIPVAKNETDLELFLKERVSVNPICFHDYIKTPFDISFMKEIIEEKK